MESVDECTSPQSSTMFATMKGTIINPEGRLQCRKLGELPSDG